MQSFGRLSFWPLKGNSNATTNSFRTNPEVLAVVLILVGSVLRVLSYFFSDNAGGDAWIRVEITAKWLEHPSFQFFFGDVYPPGHFYLIGLFSTILRNVAIAGRSLSLVLGIGSLVVVWRLAQTLYGDTAAMLSTAVFSLYSLHIGYSATSSSEVTYFFFLLLSIQLFFSHRDAGPNRLWYLMSSGICMSIAESIRYEAWIVLGGLVLILGLISIRDFSPGRGWVSLQPLLVFGSTAGIWPVLMMAHSWRVTGDPMYLVSLNRSRVIHFLAATPTPLSYQLALTPVVLILSLSPLACVAGIYGLVNSFGSRRAGAFAGSMIFFAAVQTYEILTHGLLPLARYTLTLGSMLAIISGYGLERLCNKLGPKRKRFAQVAVIVVLLMNLGAVFFMSEWPNHYEGKFVSISPRLKYAKRVAEVARYLRAHMGPREGVVIDDYNVESNLVAEAAGIPLGGSQRVYLASVQNDVGVSEYIHSERPRFLVYSDRGTLRHSLVLPSDCGMAAEIGGVGFRCAFGNEIYRVYELHYR